MKIEYFHASKYGNGARVAEEFRKQMAAQGVTVNVHHIRDVRPREMPPADLYLFSSPGRCGKPTWGMRRFLKTARKGPGPGRPGQDSGDRPQGAAGRGLAEESRSLCLPDPHPEVSRIPRTAYLFRLRIEYGVCRLHGRHHPHLGRPKRRRHPGRPGPLRAPLLPCPPAPDRHRLQPDQPHRPLNPPPCQQGIDAAKRSIDTQSCRPQ